MKDRLNLNDHVWVRFTDHGVAVRRERYAQVLSLGVSIKEVVAGEWVRMQLHELMYEIGPASYVGAGPPIENMEIRLTDPAKDRSEPKVRP